MFKFLFYLIGMVGLMAEIAWLFSPRESLKKALRFNELSKLNKGRKTDDYTPEYKDMLRAYIPSVFLVFYLIFGIFTFQWVIFLSYLLFNIIIISPLSKLTVNRSNLLYASIHWVSSLIGTAFIIFTIINAYHLHIDFTNVIAK
jgi:hypothetical protein